MHPYTRAERRHQRDRIIAYRRFIKQHVWNRFDSKIDEFLKEIANPLISMDHILDKGLNYPSCANFEDSIVEWGRYSKWNFTCDQYRCRLCSWTKSDGKKKSKKRRIALKKAAADWEKDYTDCA
jgi:hypothetical protein